MVVVGDMIGSGGALESVVVGDAEPPARLQGIAEPL